MAVTFSTITIPVLLNAPEGISLTDVQASWYGKFILGLNIFVCFVLLHHFSSTIYLFTGSLAFLVQPIGALFSGPIIDYFGRKKGSLLSIIPHIIAWTLSYFAWNLPSLFLANTLLGLGTGFMEAPINAYIGEVT